MTKKSAKHRRNGLKRHNIVMDELTRERAEILADLDKRSVSNLLVILVEREWDRLHPKEAKAA